MRSDDAQPGRLFTLPELAAAALITMLLAAFFFSIVIGSREECDGRISCMGNLKQLGLAIGTGSYVVFVDGHIQ